jgi:hypothetical protein
LARDDGVALGGERLIEVAAAEPEGGDDAVRRVELRDGDVGLGGAGNGKGPSGSVTSSLKGGGRRGRKKISA